MASDGFEFSGQGRLQRVDIFTTKAGKSILTLIIEVQGQYPQLVPIKVFGRLADSANDWQEGDVLSVSGRLGGRDWNGRVFGDIVANIVDVVSSGGQQSAGGKAQHREEHHITDPELTNSNDDSDIPF
jgi:single-stranded DNA-binding protein